jgi:DNA polymerase-3 subunit epsilon
MTEIIVFLGLVILIIYLTYRIIRWIIKLIQKQISSNKKIPVSVSFPDPNNSNDYKFLKFVQDEPKIILEAIYKEMKKRGMFLKPIFRNAIESKLKTGEFTNPLNFKNFYGTKFDLIGIHFIKDAKNPLSAFQIGICYIQNERIADITKYNFWPPKHKINKIDFYNTLEEFSIVPETIENKTFIDIWKENDLQELLTNNLIVCWDDEVEILDSILKFYKVSNYNLRYIKTREIAQKNNLPDLIDSLLLHFETDSTIEDDLSLISSGFAIDFKDSGINLEEYEHFIISRSNLQYNELIEPFETESDDDFIAIDVETAIGKRWSICQVGLAVVKDGVIQEIISELIQPPNNEFSKNNIRVHGITPEMTENKPLFPKVWEKIYPIIENKKIVAHNAEFDINCLHQTLEYYEIEIPNFDYECTFSLTGQKLVDACKSYEIKIENHHDAGNDAVACANLYLKLKSGGEIKSTKSKLEVKPKKLENYSGHEQLKGNVLKPDLENADKNSFFYSKKVVFTGILKEIERQEAAMIIQKMGADIDTAISKRTNFVVMGEDPGPSKMNKIIKYNNEGCNIRIIYEKEFLELISK